MVQADVFINLYVPKEEFIIVKQYDEIYYAGKARDIDLREVSPYDIMKVKSTFCYEKYGDEKTVTVPQHALEITIG